jgi:ubiquinone/menaquinone biosynthesis C-methylase UbiE
MTESVPTTNFSASWIRIDQTSDPSFYSALLDATRARGLDQARRDPAAVLGPLDLRAGLRVLDVGCGTGDYLRIMAPLVAPGPAVGIDLSTALIDVARERATTDGDNVSFQVGDAYELPFPNASIDRVVATQVLLHLTDPWRAVAEMRRVLAPAGLLSIGEWDWDSTCLAVTDRELGRRFTHLLCDQMHNGLIIRELPAQLAHHGFTRVAVTPQVKLSREPDAVHEWLIEPVTHELVRTGAITPREGTQLLDDLRERADTGRYFLARTYYSVIATLGAPVQADGNAVDAH